MRYRVVCMVCDTTVVMASGDERGNAEQFLRGGR